MRPCKGYWQGCEIYCGTCAYYSICGVKELPKLPPQLTTSLSAECGAGGNSENTAETP